MEFIKNDFDINDIFEKYPQIELECRNTQTQINAPIQNQQEPQEQLQENYFEDSYFQEYQNLPYPFMEELKQEPLNPFINYKQIDKNEINLQKVNQDQIPLQNEIFNNLQVEYNKSPVENQIQDIVLEKITSYINQMKNPNNSQSSFLQQNTSKGSYDSWNNINKEQQKSQIYNMLVQFLENQLKDQLQNKQQQDFQQTQQQQHQQQNIFYNQQQSQDNSSFEEQRLVINQQQIQSQKDQISYQPENQNNDEMQIEQIGNQENQESIFRPYSNFNKPYHDSFKKQTSTISMQSSFSSKDNQQTIQFQQQQTLQSIENPEIEEQNTLGFVQQTQAHVGCMCKKSKCVKFYCECLANNQGYCSDQCKCVDCKNKPEFESQRKKAIKEAQERKRLKEVSEVVGCKCKRTSCKKKYCECFNSGGFCSKFCRCEGCLNINQNQDDDKSMISTTHSSQH